MFAVLCDVKKEDPIIKIYSATGEEIFTIKCEPAFIINLDSEEDRIYASTSSLHSALSCISENGKLLWKYDFCGQDVVEFYNCLLVTDLKNSAIILCSKDGKYRKTLIQDEERLYGAEYLAYNPDTQQLYVTRLFENDIILKKLGKDVKVPPANKSSLYSAESVKLVFGALIRKPTHFKQNPIKESQKHSKNLFKGLGLHIRLQRFCNECSIQDSCLGSEKMDLKKVIGRICELAPPSLSADWDNVGLLVEPSPPHEIKTLLLTNDLTPPVLDEAISLEANMIMSYHPPLFVPIKRVTQNSWKERIITKCIENRIAIYSQHTSHDAVKDGVNDWLISAFVESKAQSKIIAALTAIKGVKISDSVTLTENLIQLNVLCKVDKITDVVMVTTEYNQHIQNLQIFDLQKVPRLGYGMGRTGTLTSPITIQDAVERVKTHLQLKHVRLASSPGVDQISSVAVCAGSGGSILKNLPVSLLVTGEMSHHEVLHAVYNGTNVILCDHSNTERGYLQLLKTKLDKLFQEQSDSCNFQNG
ncbi:hypothetical protein KUTeg_009768 [Tegillarca granosa]|uniref:NIF3-like protein 1 n=1 Tax=Tegillarca granosa TaxID=220873 RepID=A0ABQ9F4V5_TEGGR|nr:hypothetical protein KUTeg_009768 [Tegillarca granosa]